MTQTNVAEGAIPYRSEVMRKLIHLSSMWGPVAYCYISRETAIIVMLIITPLSLIIDLGRFYSPKIKTIVHGLFGDMLRKHETDEKSKKLSGATYVALGGLLCVLLYPKFITITVLSIFLIGDSFAALIGRKFGKTKFLRKSLEGSLAFFVTGIIVILFTPKLTDSLTELAIGVLTVVFAMFAENLAPDNIDDNLVIPVISGLTMWIMYYLFIPITPALFW